jgi:predicted regulator of Ras-like GTPase activity (Roadblock/LC7/MglB family)
MFNDILQRITDQCGGGIGAVLMGFDGIAVEQYFHPEGDPDLQLIAVEYANILKEIRNTAEILHLGAMEEVAIRTERFHVVVRMLTVDYFVALVLHRDGNFGKARYLLTRETGNLLAALS